MSNEPLQFDIALPTKPQLRIHIRKNLITNCLIFAKMTFFLKLARGAFAA